MLIEICLLEMKFKYTVSLLSLINLILFFFSVGFPLSSHNIDGLESAFGSKTFSITEQIKSLLSYLRAVQTV